MSIQIDAAYKAVHTAALQCAIELEGVDAVSMSLHDVLIADFFFLCFFLFQLHGRDFSLRLRPIHSASRRGCQSCLPTIGHQCEHSELHNWTSRGGSCYVNYGRPPAAQPCQVWTQGREKGGEMITLRRSDKRKVRSPCDVILYISTHCKASCSINICILYVYTIYT